MSICDWRELGRLALDASASETENLSQASSPGFFARMVHISTEQLQVAYGENPGLTVNMSAWLHVIMGTYGRQLTTHEQQSWVELLRVLNTEPQGNHNHVNKAGLLLRLLDWLQPRLQRRWYIAAYGKTHSVNIQKSQKTPFEEAAYRIAPPKTMTPPSIPAILPFNTVRTPNWLIIPTLMFRSFLTHSAPVW